MHDFLIPACDEDRALKQFLACYDAPAYIRRARAVQGALEELLARCRRQRDEWLGLVRVRLGQLAALAGDWRRLRPWLADDGQVEALWRLHAALEPRLRMPLAPTASPWVLRRALRELAGSVERFNRKWETFLAGVDLAGVNGAREGYNRYYVLEKECALRSAGLARQGFRLLPPLTREEVARLLPLLPAIELAGNGAKSEAGRSV